MRIAKELIMPTAEEEGTLLENLVNEMDDLEIMGLLVAGYSESSLSHRGAAVYSHHRQQAH